MATLKVIRKRIVSVKNTQKITKAMKMVAAAKLRRAQSALMQARPHARLLKESVERLVSLADAWDHPLIQGADEPKKAGILVITSDRGLCGGFNSNLLRKVDYFLNHDGRVYSEIRLATIGRKGRDYYRAKRVEVTSVLASVAAGFNFAAAQKTAAEWGERFRNGEIDALFLAYNHFKSAISQEPTIQQIFPLPLKPVDLNTVPPVIWEGPPPLILGELLNRFAATLFFVPMLESEASELGARMSAMENATNNASDMIHSLTLQYNRARQAAITKELMDIVNGAEALK
jgi:F-type H+-transporting ATPase subunit gamma